MPSAQKQINLIDYTMINDAKAQFLYLIIATLSKEDIFKQALTSLLYGWQVGAWELQIGSNPHCGMGLN